MFCLICLCYKLYVKVSDSEANASFVIFKDVEKLVDVTASQSLEKQDWDMEVIPSILQKLCYKTFVFKLKLTDMNLRDGLDNYTVAKMFVVNEELEDAQKKASC